MANNANGYPQSMRIKRRSDFLKVQGSGLSFRNRELIVCYRIVPNGLSRYGITVSRNVGNSVVRNRVKRRIREAIRLSDERPASVEVVFIAKSNAATAPTASLIQSVNSAFEKIGGLC